MTQRRPRSAGRSMCREAHDSRDPPAEQSTPPPAQEAALRSSSPPVDGTASPVAPMPSSSKSCLTCGETFASLGEQRAHFKLDWHRLNVKRAVGGLPSLPEAACERLLADDASSLSGSGTRRLSCSCVLR